METAKNFKVGDRLTYRSMHGGNVLVVAIADKYSEPGCTTVRTMSRRNPIYPHGHVFVASNVFLRARK